jgi:hypothetical protein
MKTLEEEARDFCEKTDKEIGEYWSNDYDELPLQIERFVKESKWVQAEKIKAQIESLNEVNNTHPLRINIMIKKLEEHLKGLEDEK